MAEGTRQTEPQDTERGHPTVDNERTRKGAYRQGHALRVEKSDWRGDQPQPVGKTG